MKHATRVFSGVMPRTAPTASIARDTSIDTMRGLAILMVIGIHSLQQPLDQSWKIVADAALRPCVPIFLFASGYLTALSGRVPLGKRLTAALIPYGIAFVAAYVYMAAQNPAMDHRIVTTAARFGLAYVFVYYYVFVYIGCTIFLWLALWFTRRDQDYGDQKLLIVLALAIVFGLVTGSYLDPLLLQHGVADGVVEEVRMRDIPFWFGFVALGMLIARLHLLPALRAMRLSLILTTVVAYSLYLSVRLLAIGDAADYDSTAFFGYASALGVLLLALGPRVRFLETLGSGSYFIYLWHIFIVMTLRDHGAFRSLGGVAGSLVIYLITTATIVLALLAIRQWAPSRAARWLGA